MREFGKTIACSRSGPQVWNVGHIPIWQPLGGMTGDRSIEPAARNGFKNLYS